MRRRTHFALILSFITSAACTADAPSSHTPPRPSGTPLRLSEDPTLAVGTLGGDTLQQFDVIVTPFLLTDGTLAVPLRRAGVIRLFGPDGGFVGSLGRRGEGPGEFMDLTAAWARGDTVEAFDGRSGRITRFAPDGQVLTVRLEVVPSAQSPVPGVLGDGWAVYGVASGGYDGGRDELRVHRYTRTGEHAGEIGVLEGMARFRGDDFTGPGPLSPRGMLVLHDDELYLGDSVEPRVQVVDASGRPVREIVWERPPAPPVDEVFRAVVDSAARIPTPGPSLAGGRFEGVPGPDRLSVFWGLLVDDEGFVWVRPFEPMRHAAALGGLRGSGPGGAWAIFSPGGEPVGKVSVPDDLELIQVTRDAVVGIARDALGVESVRVYGLERAS